MTWIICALIGGSIGKDGSKARQLEGFIAGLLLGPLGVAWVLARKAKYRSKKERQN